MKVNSSFYKRKIYFLSYLICFFITCEILCRILLPHLIERSWERPRSFVNCDAVWRIDWIKRHQKYNMLAFYNFDVYSPSRGWGVHPNMKNLTCFDNKTFNSNSKGIRGDVEYGYDKIPNKMRILILGDSFTFGEECSDRETYPYYLQQLMPGVEVINLGVDGYGHDQMLIYLTEEGLKYKPDIVMLGFMSGDIDRNMVSFRDYAKPKFELIRGKLNLRNSPVPSIESTLRSEIWKSKFFDLLTIIYNKLWQRTEWYHKKQQDTANAILNEIALTIRKMNAMPVFLYLSNIQNKELYDGLTQEETDFGRYWQTRGVECIFLRPYTQLARKEGIKIKLEGHFDSITNQIIAVGIKTFLINHNIVASYQKEQKW